MCVSFVKVLFSILNKSKKTLRDGIFITDSIDDDDDENNIPSNKNLGKEKKIESTNFILNNVLPSFVFKKKALSIFQQKGRKNNNFIIIYSRMLKTSFVGND